MISSGSVVVRIAVRVAPEEALFCTFPSKVGALMS
jgi:hypothetical protein